MTAREPFEDHAPEVPPEFAHHLQRHRGAVDVGPGTRASALAWDLVASIAAYIVGTPSKIVTLSRR